MRGSSIALAAAICSSSSFLIAQIGMDSKRYEPLGRPAGTIKAADGTLLAITLNKLGLANSASGTSVSGNHYSVVVPTKIGQGPITFTSSHSAPITFLFKADGSSFSAFSTDHTLKFDISQKWKPPAGGVAPVIIKIFLDKKLDSDSEYTTGPAILAILGKITAVFPELPAEISYFEPFFMAYSSQFEPTFTDRRFHSYGWKTIFGAGVTALECGLLTVVAGIPTAGAAVPFVLFMCAGSAAGAAYLASADTDTGHSGPGSGTPPAPTGNSNPGTGETKPIDKEATHPNM